MSVADTDFEREYRIATDRGEEELRTMPLAKKVRYDRKAKRVVLDLNNGCSLTVPPRLLQGLESASDDELAHIVIFGPGTAIEWPKLDMQYSVEGLLQGRFGNERWMEQLRKRRTAGSSAKPSRRVKAKSA